MAPALPDAVLELEQALRSLERLSLRPRTTPVVRQLGRVLSVMEGVARVEGLRDVGAGELVRFEGGEPGLAHTLESDAVGVVLLEASRGIRAGSRVAGTGEVLQVPVGPELLGRVVDPLGRPLDGAGPVRCRNRRPIESPAPRILERAPVEVPLQTGLKVVDALVPLGRGQRELVVGDRQTGKTSLVLDTILNQRQSGVLCIYCAIGQRDSDVARVARTLRDRGSSAHTVMVVGAAEAPPGLQFLAPFAATAMAEFWMRHGRDVLVVYDDLTRHAWAYRELSLLLRRPPGREAYPGDIFSLHARLLERCTHLLPALGGGSITALAVAETEAQNLAAYIPTNLISITDGQVVLSPELYRKGLLPAVDVGRSVSRVGGDAQLPAFHEVTAALKLEYAQFEELETFARFDSHLSEGTRRALERGRRVREVLRQPQESPLGVLEQLAILLAVSTGQLDEVPLKKVAEVERRLSERLQGLADMRERLHRREPFSFEDQHELKRLTAELTREV